jgi:hypothetical protein
VQVSDPRELEIPAVGMLEVVDTETGARMHVQTNSAELRARFAAAVSERQDAIRRVLGEAGAENLELSTDRDWLVDVARFLRQRRRSGPAATAGRLSGHYQSAIRARGGTTWPAAGRIGPPTGGGSQAGGHVIPERAVRDHPAGSTLSSRAPAQPDTVLHGGHRS